MRAILSFMPCTMGHAENHQPRAGTGSGPGDACVPFVPGVLQTPFDGTLRAVSETEILEGALCNVDPGRLPGDSLF